MPTPPLSDEKKRQALEALAAAGGNQTHAARNLGIDRSTYLNRLKTAQRDPAIQAAMDDIGTNMVPALAWAKTKNNDGTSYSVLLKPEAASDDVLARIRDAFDGLTPAPEIAAPLYADEDLLTLYPVSDVHIGLMAWGKETGEDFDTRAACDRLQSWVGQCVKASPESSVGVVLLNGDTLHADDQQNQTPGSKHQVDVATRHFCTLEMSISAIGSCVEMAAAHHDRVKVRVLPGNHDRTAYMAILFAIAERYRNNPRIEVPKLPGEFFVFEHGACMIAAHHGDKAKAQRLVLALADDHAEMWGRTRHRYLWTGHLHHHKSEDIGGLQWEQLRAVTARDAYAKSHAFTARAQLQAVTYHRDKGEVSRVKVAA